MTNQTLLLEALISQIPEMGEFQIYEDSDARQVIWEMFHVRLNLAPFPIKPGKYIYRYDIDEEFPYDEYDAKLYSEEGDTIYLYQIQ